MRPILGIDPGSKGFLTILHEDGTMDHYAIADGDMRDLADYIKLVVQFHPAVHVVMEEVHAIVNSSAKATFGFGEVNGYIKGMLTALGVPYTLVQPKVWQKEVWVSQDMVYDTKEGKDGKPRRVVNTKQTSYNAARRLFPNVDFRKSERCRNWDDNKVDSLLIAEYGRRRNL